MEEINANVIRVAVVMKARNHTKPKNAEEALEHKKLFAFVLEKMIVEKNVKRVCLMMDCQSAGLSNVVRMKYTYFTFPREYFPCRVIVIVLRIVNSLSGDIRN